MRQALIVALCMGITTPADAGDLQRELCAQHAVTASMVMRLRQNGWKKSTVLHAYSGPMLSILVEAAWQQPRYETDYAKRLAQGEFMRGVFNGCIE